MPLLELDFPTQKPSLVMSWMTTNLWPKAMSFYERYLYLKSTLPSIIIIINIIHFWVFISQWLMNHTDFIENILYVGGDSYSGIPIPMTVQTIVDGTRKSQPIPSLTFYLRISYNLHHTSLCLWYYWNSLLQLQLWP